MQSGAVTLFPTAYPQQLSHPSWAEYAILHLRLVLGSDRLANLTQWLAMAGSLVGVSLAARCLGATARGQALSALACATLPMGILQASTTQNDYVAALWLVGLAVCRAGAPSAPSCTAW